MSLHDPAAHPLTDAEAKVRAQQILAEWARPAATETSYLDPSPVPAYGTTPPVPQPGRPPMSQRATDASVLMRTGSIAALSVSGGASLVLYTLSQVDPAALAIGAAGPVALVLAAGYLLRSLGRAKADMSTTTTHHHYTGPVVQDHRSVTTTTTTKGMFARTRNDVHK